MNSDRSDPKRLKAWDDGRPRWFLTAVARPLPPALRRPPMKLPPLPATRHRPSSNYRISFAPETIATRRNKHNRTDQIFRKINAGDPCSAAHNGLVGGSNPPGPTSCVNGLRGGLSLIARGRQRYHQRL